MKKVLPSVLGIALISLLGVAFLLHSKYASAAVSNHVVISQVQIAGATANDEFVELYNPTANPVDLSGWRLRKETSGGTFSNIVTSISGTIPAHGYFLIAFPGEYTGASVPDLSYSATSSGIASNNTVLLYNDAGVTLIDKVGMGTATDFETTTTAVPSTGGSIQRFLDETNGHGKDTDNNSSDFEVLIASTPRNSSVIISTPTNTPSPTTNPSPTPTTAPSSTPTFTPTNTPTPTNAPIPTTAPNTMPSATPTNQPSPTPSVSPTVTPTPSITPISNSPTPTPRVIAQGPIFTCSVHYKSWRLFNKTLFFPFIVCEKTTN